MTQTTTTTTRDDSSSTPPLRVNDRCRVQWSGGSDYLDGVVVARRPLRQPHPKRKREIDMDFDSLSIDALDYYVHYIDHDRRLDEWVTINKFQLDSLQRHVAVEPAHDGVNPDAHGADSTAAAALTATSEQNDRLTRRRSSASMGDKSEHTTTTTTTTDIPEASPFSFSGGNWHSGGSSNDPASAAFEREHEETTKVKNIEKIVMGPWEVAAWYYSPFPPDYSDVETLYVCEFCLSYMKKRISLKKHKAACACRQPPGKKIYEEGDLAVFELNGKENRAYCQKLCLLAKLFLDHKTLYYDVTPFFFYVVTKVDSNGAHMVGYFSKEKVSTEGYNLACILTFPQFQKAGYGKFIISLSYELSKREGVTGSPEKPLSDLGKVSYRSYWKHVLMHLLSAYDGSSNITIQDMSTQTGIKTEDLISTLQSLDMIKVWKGQHVVYVQQQTIENYMKLDKKLRLCKTDCLTWKPPSGRPVEKENA